MSVSSVLSSKQNLVKRFFRKADVLLSVCTHRNIDIDSVTSVMGLFGTGRHSFTWCPVRGDALIDRARSRIASYFLLERKEDVLVFLDDDVLFQPQDVVRLVDNVVNGCGVVAGMYVQKGTGAKNAVFMSGQEVMFSKDAVPVEVQCVNTGFMAIARNVLEKMVRDNAVPFCDDLKFYPFFNPFPKQTENGKWIYLSEDWAFCTRARASGFKVWLDPSIFLGH